MEHHHHTSTEHSSSESKNHDPSMNEHMQMMVRQHRSMLWVHFLVVMLGFWLLTSPVTLDYLNMDVVDSGIARVTAERDLPPVEQRNVSMAWSDVISGILLIVFGTLSLSYRHRWAQWGNTFVGIWLLFAPLLFWSPSAAAYANNTLVGALVIALSILIPMMPGMSMEGMMGGPDVPPGWDYCPSTWLQRAPIIIMGFVGFILARHLTAYQMGYVDNAWEPFFADGKGTEKLSSHQTFPRLGRFPMRVWGPCPICLRY